MATWHGQHCKPPTVRWWVFLESSVGSGQTLFANVAAAKRRLDLEKRRFVSSQQDTRKSRAWGSTFGEKGHAPPLGPLLSGRESPKIQCSCFQAI
jgi:hypothetical protein